MWESFAEKGRVNAEFVVAAIRHLPARPRGLLLFQPAYQLTVEGLELVLKAMILKRGVAPPKKHELEILYSQLTQIDKSVVESAVRSAIDESSGEEIPFDIPNYAGVQLLKSFVLGVDEADEDPTSGYSQMGAADLFLLLDTEWGTDISQYVGVTRSFSIEKQTIRVNTRVLAGSVKVLLTLAEHLIGPAPVQTERRVERFVGWINSDGTWSGVPADHAVENGGVLECYLGGKLVVTQPLDNKLGWEWRDAPEGYSIPE